MAEWIMPNQREYVYIHKRKSKKRGREAKAIKYGEREKIVKKNGMEIDQIVHLFILSYNWLISINM